MIVLKGRAIAIINGIFFLLVIVMLLLIIRETAAIFLASPGSTMVQNSSKHQQAIRTKSLTDYSRIMKNNPFGFNAGELTVLGSKSEATRISGDISLVGTISGPRKFSYAIFSDKSNTQEIYKIGDSVFGSGKLERIEKDKVVINQNGKITEIQLTDVVAIRETQTPGSKDAFSGDRFARKTADTSYIVDGQKVQQALSNPGQIMTDARLLPNLLDGKQNGFALKEVRHGGIYQSLGLQDGDVLLRVNEYNISNPESALQAFNALKGMDRVQLDIIRSGAKMTMTYQIK